MNKLHDTRLLLYSIGLLISSMLERVITNLIDSRMKLDILIYHSLSLVLLIILFVFTNIILKMIIRSKLASKIAFGKSYVAGRWLELNREEKTGNIDSYCCLDISYDDDGIHVDGTNYDPNLNVKYIFNSKSASIENYALSYMYMRNLNGQLIPDWGCLVFQRNQQSPPSTYTGSFRRDDKQFQINAILVKEKGDIKLLDENFIGNFKNVFDKYYKSVPKQV